MAWLSSCCRDALIPDEWFRVLYAAVVDHMSNDDDRCSPKDETLGRACAKSGRTIRRITAKMKAAALLKKHKKLGASHYEFPFQDRPPVAAVNETRPATGDRKTGHVWPQDRPPVGRTEPSIEPS